MQRERTACSSGDSCSDRNGPQGSQNGAASTGPAATSTPPADTTPPATATPAGAWIVYMRSFSEGPIEGGAGIRIVGTDGTGDDWLFPDVKLPKGGWQVHPDWSPDGTRLAFAADDPVVAPEPSSPATCGWATPTEPTHGASSTAWRPVRRGRPSMVTGRADARVRHVGRVEIRPPCPCSTSRPGRSPRSWPSRVPLPTGSCGRAGRRMAAGSCSITRGGPAGRTTTSWTRSSASWTWTRRRPGVHAAHDARDVGHLPRLAPDPRPDRLLHAPVARAATMDRRTCTRSRRMGRA